MIELKKLTRDEFPLLLKWFSKEHVKKQWDQNIVHTLDSLKKKYGIRIDNGEIIMFIAYIDNTPFAFIQTYIESELKPYLLDESAMGIDLFIGEEAFLYKGLGPKLIKKVLREVVFQTKGINYACIDPEINNKAAIKAYSKVGYEHVNTTINKYDNTTGYFMVLSKEKFFNSGC